MQSFVILLDGAYGIERLHRHVSTPYNSSTRASWLACPSGIDMLDNLYRQDVGYLVWLEVKPHGAPYGSITMTGRTDIFQTLLLKFSCTFDSKFFFEPTDNGSLVTLNFVRLELRPQPVGHLVSENGTQEDLSYWPSKAPIKSNMRRNWLRRQIGAPMATNLFCWRSSYSSHATQYKFWPSAEEKRLLVHYDYRGCCLRGLVNFYSWSRI